MSTNNASYIYKHHDAVTGKYSGIGKCYTNTQHPCSVVLLREIRKISLNHPQYPLLYGPLSKATLTDDKSEYTSGQEMFFEYK